MKKLYTKCVKPQPSYLGASDTVGQDTRTTWANIGTTDGNSHSINEPNCGEFNWQIS